MITGIGEYPHWSVDGRPKVKLTMTEPEAMALSNRLAALRPYTGQGLEELEEAIENALSMLRQ